MDRSAKLYQDRLYGAKVLSPLAVAIIDTPEFQRLAGLRQLGFANFAYRGATHTRFEHSVGTYFVARTLMRRVTQNHERLGFDHPGRLVGPELVQVPKNALDERERATWDSPQARWRGLTEVVSIAALMHDLGHVPLGHTFEDEYTGLYRRHDRLAGSRLWRMLFDEDSELARVFSDTVSPWLDRLSNEDLRRLIFVILSWKEDVERGLGFQQVLAEATAGMDTAKNQDNLEALQSLSTWHSDLQARSLFHPFMSDLVGNTICADLLDYLPRDRSNLGMEYRVHSRLQRYLAIRPGTLYPDEGHRVAIMVVRRGRGGQRRDVATAVLDVMRERYEMAERVYYHHKKAAASAMLAKLLELVPREAWPRDDSKVYPAPWSEGELALPAVPHMVHLTDSDLISYLGNYELRDKAERQLQRRLRVALQYRRRSLYNTLLVVDKDLADSSRHAISFFVAKLRDDTGAERAKLEVQLAKAASAKPGDVIIYCPAPTMQAKEVDARLEIVENRVLPLRKQSNTFAYQADVEVLERYYQDLWRAYLFVAPEIFRDPARSQAIVDKFCEVFGIPRSEAYRKVRSYEFVIVEGVTVRRVLEPVRTFIENLPFDILQPAVTGDLMAHAEQDDIFLQLVRSNADSQARLASLFDASLLSRALRQSKSGERRLGKSQIDSVEKYKAGLLAGDKVARVAARQATERRWATLEDYVSELVETAGRVESGR